MGRLVILKILMQQYFQYIMELSNRIRVDYSRDILHYGCHGNLPTGLHCEQVGHLHCDGVEKLLLALSPDQSSLSSLQGPLHGRGGGERGGGWRGALNSWDNLNGSSPGCFAMQQLSEILWAFITHISVANLCRRTHIHSKSLGKAKVQVISTVLQSAYANHHHGNK